MHIVVVSQTSPRRHLAELVSADDGRPLGLEKVWSAGPSPAAAAGSLLLDLGRNLGVAVLVVQDDPVPFVRVTRSSPCTISSPSPSASQSPPGPASGCGEDYDSDRPPRPDYVATPASPNYNERRQFPLSLARRLPGSVGPPPALPGPVWNR